MFDRFTDRARKVMGLGRAEAQRLNHQYIGSEHILVGLMEEGSGLAANVLRNFGLNLTKIQMAVDEVTEEGPTMVSMGQLPFTPRCKRMLEFAGEEARALRHSYIGTEHLLLGITRDPDTIAAKVLSELGLSLEQVRNEVLECLGADIEPAGSNKKETTVGDIIPSGFDAYQEFTGSVAIYPGAGTGGFEAMTYCALKMCGESGEFAEKLGKRIRKGKTIGAITREAMTDEFRGELAKELGDVLWYVSQAASELGYSLSEIVEMNVEKLTSRKVRGVLDGSGDNR